MGAWLPAIEGYLAAQRAGGSPATTIYTRRQHLEHLARRAPAGPVELTPGQLVAYAAAQDWAPETRRGRRSTFRSFWAWAVAEGVCEVNAAAALRRVKPTPPAPLPVPDPVYQAARARADDRVGLMMRLAAEAGLRRAEIAQVHTRDVFQDLDGWSLRVHGKGDKIRHVPLTRRLALELRSRPAGYVFPGDDHGHLSPRWVGRLVADALGDGWTVHKLRHRAGTRWHRAAGGDVFVVQQLLGHASPATTARYVQVPSDSLRAAVEAASF